MKRTILFSLVSVASAACLFSSLVFAVDPDPAAPSSSPSPSAGTASSPQEDPRKFGEKDRFSERGGKFHRRGHHWGSHRDPDSEWKTLDRLLNLTDEQKEKVKEIMATTTPKIKAIREEQRARIQAVLDDARSEIRPVLTPAQQKVFDDAQKLREDARKLREEARALRQQKESTQPQ
jgi:hypothetical protein